MGIAAGPNVSKDGLVLYYDIANSSSFRGEPTTNLVLDPSPLGSWAVGNYLTSAATLTYETELGIPHMKISSIVYDSGYPRIAYTNLSSTVSTFSLSFEAKGTPGSKLEISFYSTGAITGTKITVTATMTNNWQRFEFPNNYHVDFVSGYPYLRPITTGSTLYIRRIQVEGKSYPTAYINGNRGTTVATGGGVIDLSGNSNSGELVNGPTYSSSFGGVVSFDGTNDHVKFPSISLTSITVSVWVRSSSWSTQTHPMIFAKGINVEWILWKSDDGGYDEKFGWRGSATIYSTTTAQNNVWYHLVASIGSSGMKLYVNGVLEASNGTTTFSSGSNQIALATGITNGTPGNYLLGDISIAKIWNRQLTDAQVKDIYNATRVRFQDRQTIVTNGLVLNLDASNRDSYIGTGNTWFDLSGFGNTGTLTNGPVFSSGFGGHIQFDGVNDFIDVGNQSGLAFTNGILTVEAWVFVPSSWTAGSQYPNLVSKGAKSGWDLDGWALFVFRDWSVAGRFSWGFGTRNGATSNIFSRQNMATNVFVHIVAVANGSNVLLYENGALQTTGTQTQNPASNSTNVLIGKDSVDNMFPGRIGHVKIYNRALSATEVLQNYNATKSRFGF